jgi:hypothetical protein
VEAQCAGASNIYLFSYNGKNYEVIRENKTWSDAAQCAVERGGFLAEINDQAEQDAIFTELSTNAGINVGNTVAPDGGNASYVWIGGNDISTEGTWIWDGDNDNNGPQFWMGTASGNPVGGLYNNWGNEPDNYMEQDALGLALTNWPLGTANQWNDVDTDNTLYYVVEYSVASSVNDVMKNLGIRIYPNPVSDILRIEIRKAGKMEVVIFDSSGQKLRSVSITDNGVFDMDLTDLKSGIYLVSIKSADGKSLNRVMVK